MIIKKACKIDLDNILSLLILVKLPIEGVSNQLENFFISVIDDTLIGCVGLEIYGESGLIRSLAVHPSHQRKGVGKLLIQSILKYAKDKGIDVCMSLIDDMPYKKEYFDVVVSTDVLEHVLDLNASIQKILSVLKQGGVFVLRVPYREDLSSYLADGYPYDLVHLRTFDEDSLRLLFEKIFNLKVIELKTVAHGQGRLRCEIKNKYYRKIIRRLVSLIEKINVKLYKNISNFLYLPAEINLVLFKEANKK